MHRADAGGTETDYWLLPKHPEPEVLGAGAVGVTQLEAGARGDLAHLHLREADAVPGVGGVAIGDVAAFYLKLEQRAGGEDAMHVADVALDNRLLRDVLE